jgi:competence protein ComEA
VGTTEWAADRPSASDNESAAIPAESPRSGPLTIRQKYLLGKRVDINKASSAEISELPGISDRIAAAVVEERGRLGRFRSPGDLLGVKGIKEKRLQKILPFLAGMPNN